uniref:Uncharacterized protein n=1 Tax=Caenorhabditis brenneri TaxID=135651 RepID=B6VBP5_CAEBE|nr:hypothetical protein Cbre_JD17.004 [Caenorhabditis brenneri]
MKLDQDHPSLEPEGL